MSFPDLTPKVKGMLAAETLRTHHHLWHFVRNEDSWNGLPDAARAQLTAAGWAAPRFEEDAGSGIDFLGMHRQMIAMTNTAMENANDPNWPSVVGWDPIPWDDNDPDWPVPEWQTERPLWATDEQWQEFTEIALLMRSDERVQQMQQVAANFQDPDVLSEMTLDEFGSAMEWSIHGWMHIRWSGAPHDEGFSSDVSNDWLFVPWSSHVNKHFWKLHGWIDERISDWESATGQTADLSEAWEGAPGVLPNMRHSADFSLLGHLPSREQSPLPMQVKQHVVEGVMQRTKRKS